MHDDGADGGPPLDLFLLGVAYIGHNVFALRHGGSNEYSGSQLTILVFALIVNPLRSPVNQANPEL